MPAARPPEHRRLIATRTGLVQVRLMGVGPPLAALHATPGSSLDLVPLGRALGARHTVILPDTPGYGWSDPLPFTRPTAADLADAIAEALGLLGVANAPFLGAHTGAQIALEIGVRHPRLMSGLVAEGLPLLTPAERESWHAGTLPPFEPLADGTHLAWAWARARDGAVFMPFNIAGVSARSPRAFPPVEAIHGAFLELHRAGRRWRDGYDAAFRHETAERLHAFEKPLKVTCRPGDTLFSHLARVPAAHALAPAPVDLEGFAGTLASILASFAPGTLAPAPALPGARGLVAAGGGAVHVRLAEGPGAPVVMLHGPGRGTRGFQPTLARLRGRRAAIAIDLPGTGGSDPLAEPTLEHLLACLGETLAARGAERPTILGDGPAAGLAWALAARVGGVALGVGPTTAEAPLDLAPRLDGGHVMAAWWRVRDRRLWSDPETKLAAGALDHPVGHDPEQLDRETLDILEGRTFDPALATMIAALPPPARPSTIDRRQPHALADLIADASRA